MSVEETNAGLQRVLDALTGAESEKADGGASPAGSADASSAGPLDEALRETWLEMWYQPKIDIKQRCLAGAEIGRASCRERV